jgi:hypothetical protein
MTRKMSDQWHKVCALLMMKMGKTHVVITAKDIQGMKAAGITIGEKPDGIHLNLISMKEAEELARMEGGLPI